MSIILVGHTQGIGKFLFERLNEDNQKVLGVSRSTGHDMSRDTEKMASLCSDFDTVILNAHQGFSQVELLYEICRQHAQSPKSIICLGSISSDGLKNYPHIYSVEKLALEGACRQLQNWHSPLRISLMKFGWVDTPRVRDLVDEPRLPLEEVYRTLQFILGNPQTHVREVTVTPVSPFDVSRQQNNPWHDHETGRDS